MNSSRYAFVVAVGVALSTLLLVGGLVTELASSVIEFSLFLGIPAGLVGAALAGFVSYRHLRSPESTTARRIAESVAGFGYAVVALAGVRYAVPPTRPLLGFGVVLAVAALVSLALAACPLLESSR
ncbi:hypothetical protein [Haloprofundus halophilus]|uniref:hypothetical protein n=1 Tax=Haloprofundus halophilus TaxID=2283527 RepID=UPI000E4388AB|nr:hypothetical protein [Haloprofundus halophilus]